MIEYINVVQLVPDNDGKLFAVPVSRLDDWKIWRGNSIACDCPRDLVTPDYAIEYVIEYSTKLYRYANHAYTFNSSSINDRAL